MYFSQQIKESVVIENMTFLGFQALIEVLCSHVMRLQCMNKC